MSLSYCLRPLTATRFFPVTAASSNDPLRAVPRKAGSLGLNARRFDGFDAAEAPIAVIDGKNLW
jgi:hypothetical protein